MTVTLDLKPEVEAEVTRRARAQGVDFSEQINQMLTEVILRHPLPLSPEEQMKKNQAAIEMLRQWREEDETDDLEEIARRQAE